VQFILQLVLCLYTFYLKNLKISLKSSLSTQSLCHTISPRVGVPQKNKDSASLVWPKQLTFCGVGHYFRYYRAERDAGAATINGLLAGVLRGRRRMQRSDDCGTYGRRYAS